MDTLVSLYPNKPICFYQFGFPSSPICNSSDSLQAAFITQAFTYWDYFANHIRLIDFTWLTDLDPIAVDYYQTYYGLGDPIFLEFLRTIGLRTWNGNGADKPALDELRCQAKQRGFNNLNLNNCLIIDTAEPDYPDEMVSVYPNPAHESVNLKLNQDLIQAEIKLFNSMGQIEKTFSKINGKNPSLSFHDLPDGVYFLIIQNQETWSNVTFSVENN